MGPPLHHPREFYVCKKKKESVIWLHHRNGKMEIILEIRYISVNFGTAFFRVTATTGDVVDINGRSRPP